MKVVAFNGSPRREGNTYLLVQKVFNELEKEGIKTEVVHSLPIPAGIFVSSLLYGVFYTAFILGLAILVFRRRDFI